MEIIDSIKGYGVKKLPCKKCGSYELKGFIKLHDGFCINCAKEHKDLLQSHYLGNKNETSISTVEKVVSHYSETVRLPLKTSIVSQSHSETLLSHETIYETMGDLMKLTGFSKAKAYRWLEQAKIIKLDNGYFKFTLDFSSETD